MEFSKDRLIGKSKQARKTILNDFGAKMAFVEQGPLFICKIDVS